MSYPEYCYNRNGKLRDEISLSLIKLLENFSKDYEFIVGVLNDVAGSKDKEILISYIKNGKDVTYENIILLSLEISLQSDYS